MPKNHPKISYRRLLLELIAYYSKNPSATEKNKIFPRIKGILRHDPELRSILESTLNEPKNDCEDELKRRVMGWYASIERRFQKRPQPAIALESKNEAGSSSTQMIVSSLRLAPLTMSSSLRLAPLVIITNDQDLPRSPWSSLIKGSTVYTDPMRQESKDTKRENPTFDYSSQRRT